MTKHSACPEEKNNLFFGVARLVLEKPVGCQLTFACHRSKRSAGREREVKRCLRAQVRFTSSKKTIRFLKLSFSKCVAQKC